MKKILIALFVAVLGSASAMAQVTAIRAGRVVDPETGNVATNQIILVEGQDIKAVGANLTIPAGATLIDLSKETVIPGMMDAHSHLCMNTQHKRDGGRYYFTTLLDSNAKRAIQGAVNAKSMLEYGFTSVRDVGNEGNYACVEVRRMIQSGEIDGPTFITAGRIIAAYGGQFRLQPDKQNLAEPEYFFADTRDEIKKAIRQNLHYGATVIKLVIDDQPYIYSVDDIKFAIEEAHLAGVKLAAHAWTAAGALNAAKAGVDSIEHAVAITDEALAIAKKNNVAITPIPFTERDAVLSGEPGGNKEANERMFIDPVRRAHKAGVTMVWGPDVIYNTKEFPRGKVSIDTVDEWKMTGIPNLVILQALTTNAAKLLGIEKTRGWIKPGFRADIIAVRDNPLEKIETVKDVVFVMRNGKVYKNQVRAGSTGRAKVESDIKRFAEAFATLVKFVPRDKKELNEWYDQAERLQNEKLFGQVPHFVRHYVSDADIRMKDEVYAEMQNTRIDTFLSFLRNGVMPTDDDLDVEG